MYFAIDSDQGHTISGWLILDNPADVPQFVIRIPGKAPITFNANVIRPDLRDHGLHSTGLVGFQIDGQLIPDLTHVSELTLAEVESDLPIFRRNANARSVQKRLLLMEVGAIPQVKLMRRVIDMFDLAYPVVDRFPLETVSSIIGSFTSSLFVSGQPSWQRHGSLAREKGFVTAALLRDPFEELAERLIALVHMKKWSEKALGNSVFKRHATLLNIVDGLDLGSEKSLLGGFRKLSAEQYNLLRSPMTRAFGCSPEEEVQRRSVSIALDNLAQFDLVGTRERFGEFSILLDALLGAPIFEGAELQTLPGAPELALILANIGLVADLIDEDIALYSFAAEAVQSGLGERGVHA
ncbi:hypothetical protein HT585_13105 [Ensifer sp. HO-A22]|uniref:Uncharacterized protein n=1 Tax=Ensifer oleiphilus TaxID=2742698 RepID=A0A7Y6Q657_9HYPH|nr:hypothetical protein [Ensifer oleiphilus]NVD39799.1 hypothetical protein [Ensifer oleiphilus]